MPYIQYGETDLLFVCKKRNLKIIKQLLRKGANPNLANRVSQLRVFVIILSQLLYTLHVIIYII